MCKLFKNFLQLLRNGISNLDGAVRATDIFGSDVLLDNVPDGVFDSFRFGREMEGVLEHHGDREDGADGVDDALAGDVGCRSCPLLVLHNRGCEAQ